MRLATSSLKTRHERQERDALQLYVEEVKAKIAMLERDWSPGKFKVKNKIYASVSATLFRLFRIGSKCAVSRGPKIPMDSSTTSLLQLLRNKLPNKSLAVLCWSKTISKSLKQICPSLILVHLRGHYFPLSYRPMASTVSRMTLQTNRCSSWCVIVNTTTVFAASSRSAKATRLKWAGWSFWLKISGLNLK